jgi:hypothetical protein
MLPETSTRMRTSAAARALAAPLRSATIATAQALLRYTLALEIRRFMPFLAALPSEPLNTSGDFDA